MVAPNITDPFFKKLYNRLVEDLDNRVNSLAKGSALTIGEKGSVDIEATAMKYQAAVAHIDALQQVIELGIEIDHDHYGKREKDQTGDY